MKHPEATNRMPKQARAAAKNVRTEGLLSTLRAMQDLGKHNIGDQVAMMRGVAREVNKWG